MFGGGTNMAMTVKSAQLWVLDANDRAGLLADTLEPLASAGAALRVVMAYRHPGQTDRAAIEVFPIKGKKAEAAARAAGMQPSLMACLVVEGDDRPGTGAQLGRAIAGAGISFTFMMGQVIGKKFSVALGFANEQEAAAAAQAIKSSGKRRS
jgi:hypothetical protein